MQREPPPGARRRRPGAGWPRGTAAPAAATSCSASPQRGGRRARQPAAGEPAGEENKKKGKEKKRERKFVRAAAGKPPQAGGCRRAAAAGGGGGEEAAAGPCRAVPRRAGGGSPPVRGAGRCVRGGGRMRLKLGFLLRAVLLAGSFLGLLLLWSSLSPRAEEPAPPGRTWVSVRPRWAAERAGRSGWRGRRPGCDRRRLRAGGQGAAARAAACGACRPERGARSGGAVPGRPPDPVFLPERRRAVARCGAAPTAAGPRCAALRWAPVAEPGGCPVRPTRCGAATTPWPASRGRAGSAPPVAASGAVGRVVPRRGRCPGYPDRVCQCLL